MNFCVAWGGSRLITSTSPKSGLGAPSSISPPPGSGAIAVTGAPASASRPGWSTAMLLGRPAASNEVMSTPVRCVAVAKKRPVAEPSVGGASASSTGPKSSSAS